MVTKERIVHDSMADTITTEKAMSPVPGESKVTKNESQSVTQSVVEENDDDSAVDSGEIHKTTIGLLLEGVSKVNDEVIDTYSYTNEFLSNLGRLPG